MPSQHPQRSEQPPSEQPPATPPPQRPTTPWRTEGLPKGQPPNRQRAWFTGAAWLIGYLLLFGTFTLQDQLSGPEAIPYTEFKNQVAGKNVSALFARGDSIQGELRKAAPIPEQSEGTYQQFTTERPTFAGDDLLAELTAGGAAVRATPLVRQRGLIANLLISFAPILLLVAFYVWMLRRQQGAMAGGLLGPGRQKRVDPESVR